MRNGHKRIELGTQHCRHGIWEQQRAHESNAKSKRSAADMINACKKKQYTMHMEQLTTCGWK